MSDIFEATNRRVRKAVDRLRLLAGQDQNGNGLPFRVDDDGRLEVVSYRTNHAARVYNSADISHTTSGSYQAITFDTESLDDDGMHSLVSNTDRLTIVHTGLYLVGGSVQWAAHGTGQRLIQVQLNGSTALGYSYQLGNATYQVICEIGLIASLAAGNYLQLRGYQDSDGALNMIGTGVYSPSFWCARL